MYGSPHKKSGLPGLMGTHDKNSPLPFVGAVLAGLGKAAAVVGKVGAKVGMAVAKTAPKVLQSVKTGVQAAGGAIGKAGKAVGDAGKFVGKNVAKGAQKFAGKDGFVSKTVKQGKELAAKGKEFAKTSKGKAIIGGLYAGKKAADKQVAEVNQSIYNQKNRGGVGDFSKINFGNRV
tara:strand:+ start:344 stop:871 length:528 start_codon:yes stop_codon:yes gene_type:complete